MLAYFMSRIRIDALHVDVNDVLPRSEWSSKFPYLTKSNLT